MTGMMQARALNALRRSGRGQHCPYETTLETAMNDFPNMISRAIPTMKRSLPSDCPATIE